VLRQWDLQRRSRLLERCLRECDRELSFIRSGRRVRIGWKVWKWRRRHRGSGWRQRNTGGPERKRWLRGYRELASDGQVTAVSIRRRYDSSPDIGLEPPTFSLGRATPEGVERGTAPQVLTNPHKPSGGPVQGTQLAGQNPKGFVARFLPAARTTLRAHRGGRDGRLLTVAEVAEELAVCTATVYKLVASSELPNVRVLDSIRVRREDLDTFERTTRSGF
jgi:excisionase family DNA binding protein